jgi:hypothetical protein
MYEERGRDPAARLEGGEVGGQLFELNPVG